MSIIIFFQLGQIVEISESRDIREPKYSAPFLDLGFWILDPKEYF